jgi:hypothetical protein
MQYQIYTVVAYVYEVGSSTVIYTPVQKDPHLED